MSKTNIVISAKYIYHWGIVMAFLLIIASAVFMTFILNKFGVDVGIMIIPIITAGFLYLINIIRRLIYLEFDDIEKRLVFGNLYFLKSCKIDEVKWVKARIFQPKFFTIKIDETKYIFHSDKDLRTIRSILNLS